jgi:multidrug efflux pump subunit AcrB
MWIVKIALNRPSTFIVLALLILIASPVVILGTPTDIFPSINIPVVAVAWTYTGLSPEEMEGRITTVYERILTTTVDNIEHIESTTVNGTAIVKIYLQPSASIDRRMRRLPRFHRRSFANYRQAPCPRSSSITTRPRFRSFNLASRAKTSQNPS